MPKSEYGTDLLLPNRIGKSTYGRALRWHIAQMTSLSKRLASGEVILIDGATGTELERRGVPMVDKLWCGMSALTHPDR